MLRDKITAHGAILSLLAAMLFAACSVTEHLPEGEALYTGVARITHQRVDTVDEAVGEVVATALEVQPNSALFGSAYRMSPFPVGLWFYNGLYTERETGLRHWLWSHFKSDPTLVSQVNPRLRAQAAEAALKDEGYFDALVTFDTVYDARTRQKAKISYDVQYRHQSRLGKVTYLPSPSSRVDNIVRNTLDAGYLRPGERFSASNLERERQRIAEVMQDSGYFFFNPELIRFFADTTRQANTVDLRVMVAAGAALHGAVARGDSLTSGSNLSPAVVRALTPCTIDSVHYHLDYGAGLKSQNHDTLRFMTVGYNGPQMVQTRYLRRALGFRQHALYNPDRINLAKTLISRLNIFKYTTTEFQVLNPAASDAAAGPSIDTDTASLRLVINAMYDLPWSGTTEIGCVYKDNEQVGPGVTLTATKRNLWGGGERLNFQLTGAYEWMTGHHAKADGTLLNSYELGAKASISVPRLQLPRLFRPSRENPVTSTYGISLDWIRRSGLFEMVKGSGSIDYTFSLDRQNTFTFTPLKLTYVSLVKESEQFLQLTSQYPSLKHSFENQFIPQLQLSWTYDNAPSATLRRSSQYLNVTLSEAGGIIDLLMGEFGTHRKQGERQLFFQPFSQFVKLTAEMRNLWHLTDHLDLASRLMGGIGYAYGNSEELPYAETFYIGGPNSLRGFPVRGVGPGNFFIEGMQQGPYDYLNRVGDIKLEGNVELRFPIAGSLNGALFVDAGNVWLSKTTSDYMAFGSHGSKHPTSEFFSQLALDSGLGLRLDMGMLVLRFDVGVPLHDPMSGGGYFNCQHAFFRNLGYNLAVGYPF